MPPIVPPKTPQPRLSLLFEERAQVVEGTLGLLPVFPQLDPKAAVSVEDDSTLVLRIQASSTMKVTVKTLSSPQND